MKVCKFSFSVHFSKMSSRRQAKLCCNPRHSRMLHYIRDDDHIQWHPPLISVYTNFWPCYWSGTYYRICLFTLLSKASIEHLQRCGMPTDGAYFSVHLVLSNFGGTCMCSNVETNLFWTCLDPRLLIFEHPLGTSVLLVADWMKFKFLKSYRKMRDVYAFYAAIH